MRSNRIKGPKLNQNRPSYSLLQHGPVLFALDAWNRRLRSPLILKEYLHFLPSDSIHFDISFDSMAIPETSSADFHSSSYPIRDGCWFCHLTDYCFNFLHEALLSELGFSSDRRLFMSSFATQVTNIRSNMGDVLKITSISNTANNAAPKNEARERNYPINRHSSLDPRSSVLCSGLDIRGSTHLAIPIGPVCKSVQGCESEKLKNPNSSELQPGVVVYAVPECAPGNIFLIARTVY
ncbi:hypothetical protein ACTXT7_007569 [Hymenolepis weldensis]